MPEGWCKRSRWLSASELHGIYQVIMALKRQGPPLSSLTPVLSTVVASFLKPLPRLAVWNHEEFALLETTQLSLLSREPFRFNTFARRSDHILASTGRHCALFSCLDDGSTSKISELPFESLGEVKFTQNGKRVAMVDRPLHPICHLRVRILDAVTWGILRETQFDISDNLVSVYCSPDDGTLAVLMQRNLYVLDADMLTQIKPKQFDGVAVSMKFSKSGDGLAVVFSSQPYAPSRLYLLNPKFLDVLHEAPLEHDDNDFTNWIKYCSSGEHLVVDSGYLWPGTSSRIRIFDASSLRMLHSSDLESPAMCIRYHPNGSRIAVTHLNGHVRLLDASLHELRVADMGAEEIKYAPCGESLAVVTRDKHVCLLDSESLIVLYDVALPMMSAPTRIAYEHSIDGSHSQIQGLRHPLSEDFASSLPIIQSIEHVEPAAIVDADVAASLEAVVWADRVERSISANFQHACSFANQPADSVVVSFTASQSFEAPASGHELLEDIYLVSFDRHPRNFSDALLHGLPLSGCRRKLQEKGVLCELPSGAKVFVHPNQYEPVMTALSEMVLKPYHVIVAESLEYLVDESLQELPRNQGIHARLRSLLINLPTSGDFETTLPEDAEKPLHDFTVKRTFISIGEDRPLFDADLVSQSTTEAHGGGVNPRRMMI